MLILKKLIPVFAFFCATLCLPAQELFSDDRGVKVFYEIKKTDKITFCDNIVAANENFSEKKIQVWKITLGIKNGHHSAIIPRGVGIANISIHSNPLKPYPNEYCVYGRVKNYEPSNGWLDQSLFAWPIREFKVEEIAPNVTMSNTTYLYLYEGQAPKVTNSEFLGYQLKESAKDKKQSIVTNPISSAILPDRNDNQKNRQHPVNQTTAEIKEIKRVQNFEIENNDLSKINKNTIALEIEVKDTNLVDTSKTSFKEAIPAVNSNLVEGKIEITNDKAIDDNKCNETKALEYKNKVSTNVSEQRAYSWLALYYTYKCECEKGSNRSDDLIIIINNVVDNYSSNTNSAYGSISKVAACKKLTE